MGIPEHLTPEQCGELAAAAAPKELALTHFYPPVEQVDVRALVGARYAGPVTLAVDGREWHFETEDT
jgi:ribonuclease BN (tRNA processing enzyme)